MIKALERFRTWTENPRVGGSIPPLATIRISDLMKNETRTAYWL